ncbi:RHS repeat domain-containing protein [Streptomyces tauricus]|uniref:RHS repeat domain-containing protein n=1 Tax=Streptomyces tauricus TaxID=68274 RepID=UPI00344A7AF6
MKLSVSGSGKTKALSGTRYYAGGAVRTVGGGKNELSFQAGDHHGTMSLTVKADATQTATRRYLTPFGTPRGDEPTTWPDDKAFLGKPVDETTGLTHVGAREYDPAIGRFISVDPVLDGNNPWSLDGYSYANNSPVTQSDPSGLYCDGCSVDNPDSVWAPDKGNGPGCTHSACYDHDGKVLYTIHSGGGGGGGGNSVSHGGGGSVKQPEIVPGVAIPTEEDLRNRGYDPWKNQTYTQLLVKWSDGQCLGDSSSQLCKTLNALGWVSPKQDFLELIGVRDAIDCAKGSVSGCVWTAVGLLPVGKLAKAAKLVKKGDNAAAAALACVRRSFLPAHRCSWPTARPRTSRTCGSATKSWRRIPRRGRRRRRR